MTEFVVVIPARFESERLPGKPLRLIGGMPMIEHVWRRAKESEASQVVIATDDERIRSAAEGFGATVCMTSTVHRSGTERIAEVADILQWQDDQRVINLQGDEPLMPPQVISECAVLLDDPLADMATLASPVQSMDEFHNSNVVKVVLDENSFALYFSRAPIPYGRGSEGDELALATALHHHGIYGYRCAVLRRLVAAEPSAPERCEHLEQLRALGLGQKIKVGQPTMRPGPGVDTEADLVAVNDLLMDGSP
jgi:3-deoxy-manno-octulosonate cytidylyltransferase (CMP-KDO synthetase)